MIFSNGIKGMGYAPDYDGEKDEDFLEDELYNQQEEEAMERYYEEKYNK